jgi:hypothetical protein
VSFVVYIVCVILPGLMSPVPVTGQHFWVLVCSHQWGWHVCNILHHVLQITDALVVQSHIPVLFYFSLHLRSDQLVHICHHGCLRHNKGNTLHDVLWRASYNVGVNCQNINFLKGEVSAQSYNNMRGEKLEYLPEKVIQHLQLLTLNFSSICFFFIQ